MQITNREAFAGIHTEGSIFAADFPQGVEPAIEALGRGFLSHPANISLREKLSSGEMSKQDYYRQILCLVYRLIFLFVAENKNLLLDPNADSAARSCYQRYYSATRLKRLSEERLGTRCSDLYHGFRFIAEKLGSGGGCNELGLPALGGFLFSKEPACVLDACETANGDLLDAVRSLCFITCEGLRRSVDFKNLGSEVFGSVYESLLELQPELDLDTGAFALKTANGLERKARGIYYTPKSLVLCLLDSALDPVLDEAAKKNDPQRAILSLKVCDPACGSGYFLVAAAQRIARRLAFVRTEGKEPSPEVMKSAIQDVIGKCIYGVDINEMSVELCKVSLWMEALIPAKPLSFLDHHIKCGNSLIGATPRMIAQEIPYGLKQSIHESLVASTDYRGAEILADTWCAAFLWKETKNRPLQVIRDAFRLPAKANGCISEDALKEIKRLAGRHRFFHWYLAFPDVFRVPGGHERPENESTGWSGGFDAVLGNPPYGAELSKKERGIVKTLLPHAKRTSNTAADFIELSGKIVAPFGRVGLVVPKSITYSYSWEALRSWLSPVLTHVVDVSKAWRDVLLEQVLITYGSPGRTALLPVKLGLGRFAGSHVDWHWWFRQGLMESLGTIPTGLNARDKAILDQMFKASGHRLGEYCATRRGTGIQNLTEAKGDVPVLAGKDISHFKEPSPCRFINRDLTYEKNIRLVKPPQVVFQNIVAHITRPSDHIRLIGTVLRSEYACLDTVNILSSIDSKVSPWALAALLMSDLINWYVYVCIYNRAIRTMHFDGYFLNKIVTPECGKLASLHDFGQALEIDPREKDIWIALNEGVFDLYNVEPDLREGVRSMHKPRWLAARHAPAT